MTPGSQAPRPLNDPRRLVYAGNAEPPAEMASLSSWDLDVTTLVRRLALAEELVVLDPLSFPWEFLSDEDRSLPLVVVLPESLDGPAIAAALGPVVLADLAPQDRLVEHRRGVRDHLSTAFGLPPDAWLDVGGRDEVMTAIVRHTRRGLVELETRTGRFVAPWTDLVTEHLRVHGAHQGSDLAMLRSVVHPGDVVVDVGAHIGTFAIPLANAVGETGRVVAFEAAADMVGLLLENVVLNGLQDVVEVHHVAVGTSRIPQVPAHRVPGNSGATRWHGSMSSGMGETPATTLDDWWQEAGEPHVHVVKVDVEGAEPDVLSGGARLLEACRPIVLVELILGGDGAAQDVVDGFSAMEYVTYRNNLDRNRSDDAFDAVRVTDVAFEERVVDLLAVPRQSPAVQTLDGGAG